MSDIHFGFSESDGLGFEEGIFSSIEPDVNHVERGLARLPSQFYNSTILKTLLQIYLEELQEIEETLYDIKRFSSIDEAFGFQLDIIGEVLGKRREGLLDEEYRKYLKVQVI